MNIWYVVISVAAAILELVLTFTLFFSDLSDYFEALDYDAKSDLETALDGEYMDAKRAGLKLWFFHAGGVLTGISVYFILLKHFG